jgi:hypothetical protein
MIRAIFLFSILLFNLFDASFAATRVAYTRPGVMMKIPFSTVGRVYATLVAAKDASNRLNSKILNKNIALIIDIFPHA